MKKAKHHIQTGRTWDTDCCSYCAGELVSLPPKYGQSLNDRIVVCPNCLARIVLEIRKQAQLPDGEEI